MESQAWDYTVAQLYLISCRLYLNLYFILCLDPKRLVYKERKSQDILSRWNRFESHGDQNNNDKLQYFNYTLHSRSRLKEGGGGIGEVAV